MIMACMQVYEYLDSDLECLIRDRATIISAADVKSYMQMMLKGLAFCHKHWILHRDVKPNNFLISMSGASLLPGRLLKPGPENRGGVLTVAVRGVP